MNRHRITDYESGFLLLLLGGVFSVIALINWVFFPDLFIEESKGIPLPPLAVYNFNLIFAGFGFITGIAKILIHKKPKLRSETKIAIEKL